jgi:RNA ligase (TIGR02306 family)
MRALATIDSILGIEPIPDADAIEQARVRGWTIVTKKGEFTVGDPCVYIEVDSALPMTDSRFEFLAPRGTKTLGDGKVVHVLRTAKLRGVYSQGLALPVDAFPELTSADLEPGQDVAGLLGITLYEPPLPASTNGEIIGTFPTRFASKSDAERVQNMVDAWDSIVAFGPWIATEKLDGSSVTVINDEGTIRACSRNYELAESDTIYWNAAREIGEFLNPGEAVQAEIWGEGVQANPLKILGRRISVFALWRDRRVLPLPEWPEWAKARAVPVWTDLVLPNGVDEAVRQADGIRSLINPDRIAEGVVWHQADGKVHPSLDRACFKVISNKYLLKHGG